ncbi:hypothetical protein [Lactobacillus sp. PV034]|uniref:hypothetical protein n=1 Tax=Lactobacillus sp. PV034 TaxID=2594495 RepID=UPI00223FB923|nr:hypothetical protein [Lactobacillus sp. PV034]QNQ80506.1 hypothetical protein FP432_02530 [Lactobacillus sp. PV034]
METRPKWLQVFNLLKQECIFDKWEFLYTPLFQQNNNTPTPKEFKQDKASIVFSLTFDNSQDLFASIAGGNIKVEPAMNNADFDDMYTTLTGGVISAEELNENVQYNTPLLNKALEKKVSRMQNVVKMHFPEEYEQGEHDWNALFN